MKAKRAAYRVLSRSNDVHAAARMVATGSLRPIVRRAGWRGWARLTRAAFRRVSP